MRVTRWILLLSIIISCGGKNEISPIEYIDWYRTNKVDFTKVLHYQSLDFNIRVIPEDLLIAQAVKKGLEYQDYELLKKDLNKTISCVLTFSINGEHPIYGVAKDQVGYDDLLQYYLYEFAQDLSVKFDENSYQILNFEMVRNFGHKPKLEFVFEIPIANKKDKDAELMRLNINNRTLDIGSINIDLKEIIGQLNTSPSLKLNDKYNEN